MVGSFAVVMVTYAIVVNILQALPLFIPTLLHVTPHANITIQVYVFLHGHVETNLTTNAIHVAVTLDSTYCCVTLSVTHASSLIDSCKHLKDMDIRLKNLCTSDNLHINNCK